MAMVLDFFVKRYLGKLSDFIEGEISKVLGVKGELARLHRKLSRISPYIQDAEKRRHRNPAINNWVNELKDIIYDADDILDHCMVEGGRLLEVQSSASSRICSPIILLASCLHCSKFRRNIWNKIKGVNDRLDEIKDDNNVVPRLVAQKPKDFPDNLVRTPSCPTSSTHVVTDIVGTQIVDAAQKLISEIARNKEKCSVLGISGMGGIGKTTLAQKIFNDEMIKKQFPNRVWLHVSKHYSEIELLKQVLKGVGGNDDGVQSRDEIEKRIIPFLSESLLIVLDDIWSANIWTDLLRNVILNGSCRTAILFTTRHEDMITEMRSDFFHRVDKMNDDGSWKLIRKIVFGDEKDVIIFELKEIGMEIVKKCDGLPLAIKVVASVLLHKERTKREWRKVVESDLWLMKNQDKLSNALYLSYEDLPCHLKQCFLSCAFYHGISNRYDIIRLWVAEGFVIEQSDSLMEDIAEDYYKELIARNLLQLEPLSVDDSKFVMHDVLQSFGENLMKEEGIIINDAPCTSTNSSTKIRHLSISNQGDEELLLPNVIIEQKCLRALQFGTCPQIKRIDDHVFESLKRLRVLDLYGTSMDSLPDSLTKLLHLRYLDLQQTNIRKLPESIDCLANLQTLNLSGCESLHELPKGITKLINLRGLVIRRTPLTHVPKGIGKLKNLNHLDGFLVGHCDDSMSKMGEGCDLEELQYLCNLTYLVIDKLERATATGNRNTVLANKRFLRRLKLNWTENNGNTEEQITVAERICNQLSPPATLKELWFFNFPGRQFPAWMVSTSVHEALADLTYLDLLRFPSCMMLPPLGQLPNLKYLRIERGEAIRSIGAEFLGCRTPAFPKLEYLIFKSMPNWEAWVLREAQDVEEDTHASNLNLFPNLKQCAFLDCQNLKNSILPPTRFLKIFNCPNLEYVEKFGMLEELEIIFPAKIQQLPQWVSSLINATLHSLQTFYMRCDLLLLNSFRKEEPNWHIIQQIPQVDIYSIDWETRLSCRKDSKNNETGNSLLLNFLILLISRFSWLIVFSIMIKVTYWNWHDLTKEYIPIRSYWY